MRRQLGSRLTAASVAAILAAGALPAALHGQGMAAAGKRSLPPIALPEGMVPGRADFVDVAATAGLAGDAGAGEFQEMTYLPETTGTGVALVDFDGDGLLDVFLVGQGRSVGNREGRRHSLYRNLGGLRFEDASRAWGLEGTGWGQGVCAGDADGDGFTDLFVTHWGPDALLRNLDGARFRDEAFERGVAGGTRRWSTGCSFADVDRDGDLDLFVAHYVDFDPDSTPLPGDAPQCAWKGTPIPCGPRGLAGESMSLFANDGAGRFSDVTEESGVATDKRYHGLGVLTADFDADGWPDVFVACDSTPNLFFRNRGDGTFEEAGLLSAAAYDENGHEQAGMGVAAADYDGDGLLDLFQTNFAADTNTLYANLGDALFRDRTVAAGLATVTGYVGWGAEFLDYDRDGWPDLFAVNGHVSPSIDRAGSDEAFAQPRLLFWNRGDGIFHDVSGSAGSGVAASRPSRGSAVGDLDNDGDLELVVANMGGPPSLLQNQADAAGNWLIVRTVSRSGSDAVGARVTVTAGGRAQVAEVRSGGSYLSQSSLRPHFGLGDAAAADVEVRWPSTGAVSTVRVTANRTATIREEAGEAP